MARSGSFRQKSSCRKATSPRCSVRRPMATAQTAKGVPTPTGQGSCTVSNTPASASQNAPSNLGSAQHLSSLQDKGTREDGQTLLKADSTIVMTNELPCRGPVERDAVPESTPAPSATMAKGLFLKPSKGRHRDISKSRPPEVEAVNHSGNGNHELPLLPLQADDSAEKKSSNLHEVAKAGKLEGPSKALDITSLPEQGDAAGISDLGGELGPGSPPAQVQGDPSRAGHPSVLNALSLHQAWGLIFHGQAAVDVPLPPTLGPVLGLTSGLPSVSPPAMPPSEVQSQAQSVSLVPSSIQGTSPFGTDQMVRWLSLINVKKESQQGRAGKKRPNPSATSEGTADADAGSRPLACKSSETNSLSLSKLAAGQGEAELVAFQAKHSIDPVCGNRFLITPSVNDFGLTSHQSSSGASVALGSDASRLPHTMAHLQGRNALFKPPPGFELGRSMVFTGSHYPSLSSAYFMNDMPTFNQLASGTPYSGLTAYSTSHQKNTAESIPRMTATAGGKDMSDSGSSIVSDSNKSAERNARSGWNSPGSTSPGLPRHTGGVERMAEFPVPARAELGGQPGAGGTGQLSGATGPDSAGVLEPPQKQTLSKQEGSMSRPAKETVSGAKEKPQRSQSSFEKLMDFLEEALPDAKRDELKEIIAQIRESNGNSLSGLKTSRIIEVAVNLYRRKKSQPSPPFANTTAAKKPLPEEEECSICYESLSEDPMQVLECGHRFHSKCIKEWIGTYTRTCPTCRNHTLLPDEFPALT